MDVDAVLAAARRAVATRPDGRRADVPRMHDLPVLRPPHGRAHDEARLPHRGRDRALADARPRVDGAARRSTPPSARGSTPRSRRCSTRRSAFARASAEPDPATALDFVYATGLEPRGGSRAVTAIRYLPAMGRALRDEMAADPSVFVVGEDVRASLRGVTKGLYDEFGPDRVLDMPISEQMFTGFATGAALAGRRPRRRVPDPVAALPRVRADREPGAEAAADDGRPGVGAGRLPRARLGRAARARGAALRPPLLALRARGREDRPALDTGGCVRTDALGDPRRRSRALPRTCGGAAGARRAAGRAGARADRQRPDRTARGAT